MFRLMARSARRASISVLIFFSLIVFAFQNCGGQNSFLGGTSSSTSSSPQLNSTGGGDGYDGMQFVSKGTCGTMTNAIRSKIVVSRDQTTAHLLIDNCQTLSPAVLLPQAMWSLLPTDPVTLAYGGMIYVPATPVPDSAPAAPAPAPVLAQSPLDVPLPEVPVPSFVATPPAAPTPILRSADPLPPWLDSSKYVAVSTGKNGVVNTWTYRSQARPDTIYFTDDSGVCSFEKARPLLAALTAEATRTEMKNAPAAVVGCDLRGGIVGDRLPASPTAFDAIIYFNADGIARSVTLASERLQASSLVMIDAMYGGVSMSVDLSAATTQNLLLFFRGRDIAASSLVFKTQSPNAVVSYQFDRSAIGSMVVQGRGSAVHYSGTNNTATGSLVINASTVLSAGNGTISVGSY